MRITILGLPGSGKSTLARNISEKLSIPYIQLDRFWLEAGGGHNSKSTADPERAHTNVRTKALEAIQSDSWVSDGVYSKVQPEIAERADTIVFLDISLLARLANHAARTMHRKNRHGEMSFLSDLQFFREIIARDMRKKTKIRKFVEEYPAKSVILRNRKEIDQYLASLN
jgi:adenylate kinase family enzyme